MFRPTNSSLIMSLLARKDPIAFNVFCALAPSVSFNRVTSAKSNASVIRLISFNESKSSVSPLSDLFLTILTISLSTISEAPRFALSSCQRLSSDCARRFEFILSIVIHFSSALVAFGFTTLRPSASAPFVAPLSAVKIEANCSPIISTSKANSRSDDAENGLKL